MRGMNKSEFPFDNEREQYLVCAALRAGNAPVKQGLLGILKRLLPLRPVLTLAPQTLAKSLMGASTSEETLTPRTPDPPPTRGPGNRPLVLHQRTPAIVSHLTSMFSRAWIVVLTCLQEWYYALS